MDEKTLSQSGITFSEADINKYPLLLQLDTFLDVFAIKGSDYEGLKGTIVEINYGEDRETENESIVEIVVDFENPSEEKLSTKYAHLNGTSIEQVIMDENELAICFDLENYQMLNGQLVCQDCFTPITFTNRRFIEEHSYTWNGEKYEYDNSEDSGSSDMSFRCGVCGATVDVGPLF